MLGIGHMDGERAEKANREQWGDPEIGNNKKSSHHRMELVAGVTWPKLDAWRLCPVGAGAMEKTVTTELCLQA